MIGGFELFVAGRYLRAKRKQAVISVITVISILGVAAGVMALVVALAITNVKAAGAKAPDSQVGLLAELCATIDELKGSIHEPIGKMLVDDRKSSFRASPEEGQNLWMRRVRQQRTSSIVCARN